MGKKGRLLLLLGAVIALGVPVWLWFSQPPKRQPPADYSSDKRPDRPASTPDDLERFVGSEACARCHEKISRQYAQSGMARSWRAVDEQTLGDFGNATVEDDKSGYRYRVLREEGRIFQEETRLAPEGESSHQLRVQADYTVGSGNHAQAMVAEHNGYLHQLPIAWFSASKSWRLNPGYELVNHRFSRAIPPGCVECHGPIAAYEAPTRNRFQTPLAEGIGCERCHGPGREHVAYWDDVHARNLPALPPKDPEAFARASMVHPRRDNPHRTNDVCMQCHLQGDVTVFQPGSGPFCFRPGEDLSAHRLDFLVKTDQPESFGLASHGARMMQSRCYLESEPKLTCIHCHDPHLPTRAFAPSYFDARCTDCHPPASCMREVPPGMEKKAEGCVGCHMPRRPTREGQHLVFTDHWIRKRPASKQPSPMVLSANADVELINIWPGADPHRLRLGCAYVKLHETVGPQTQALERGLRILLEAKQKGHEDVESRYSLGSALIGLQRGADAIDVLQGVVSNHPGHLQARFRLGIAWDQVKQYDRAVREYEAVIASAPAWMEPYPLLARLYLFREQPQPAIALLERQRKYNPDAGTFAQLAMARHLQGESIDTLMSLLDEALRRDPRLVQAYLYRAYFHTTTGKLDQARASYRAALAIEPGNPIALDGLKGLEGR